MMISGTILSQTLIINEVSNGPTGNQEYVEFVVVDVTATYDCSGSAPPCIDIRGWIFDDNSGYHGTTGVAAGAVRFSNDPIWSCVPLGTIIVIYNDADPNIDITSSDVSMTDGNCSLIVPLNNLQYFEFTGTTPGDVSCSYPTTGWGTDATPTWSSNTALANGGDCARLVDLNGCEVFSLCYGSASSNPLIYFSGSGSDDVWYFNDGDPYNQSNWSEGCAGDIATCGSDDQTPGYANNAANAAYIAQFNNYCSPITPIDVTANSTSGCGCTGTGTAVATGSIAGYTYEWLDSNFNPIGQSTDEATGLCDGTYNVIATSSIGCLDTAQIVISTASGASAGSNGILDTCQIIGNINLFDYLGGTPDNLGSWSGPSYSSASHLGTIDLSTAQTGQYIYTIGSGGCSVSSQVSLTVLSPPTLNLTPTNISCFGSSDGSITASASGNGPFSFVWNNGLPNGISQDNLDVGNYEAIVTDANGCVDTSSVSISEPTEISLSIGSQNNLTCNGASDGTVTILSTGGSGSYNYDIGNGIQTSNAFNNLSAGNYTVTVSDLNNINCSKTIDITISEPSSIALSLSSTNSNCGQADGSVTVIASGGTILSDYNYSWIDDNNQPIGTTSTVNNLSAGYYFVTITDDNSCSLDDSILINDITPNISIIEDSTSNLCFGGNDGSASLTINSPNSYNISWSGPNGFSSNLESINSLTFGIYTYEYSDLLGCEINGQIEIAQPSSLSLIFNIDSTTCSSACDGSISVSATGGTSPYNITSDFPSWTNGTSNLCIGTYQFIVTDDNGCTFTTDTSVFDRNQRDDATITLTDFDYCSNESDFLITTNEQGGVWTTNGTGLNTSNGSFSPLTSNIGTQEIIYSFPGTCGDADTITIEVFASQDASFSIINTICENESPINLTATNSGGVWSGSGVNNTTATFTPTSAGDGIHTITYILSGTCPDTVQNNITVLPVQNPIISGQNNYCIDQGNVQLTTSIGGGVWSGSANLSGVINPSNLGNGSYSAVYTIATQCGSSDTITFEVHLLPDIQISVNSISGCTPLTIDFNDQNSISGNSYSWSLDGLTISSDPQDTFTITDAGCQELSVTVTNSFGCSNTSTYSDLICTENYPIANFNYNPENPSVNESLINFNNLSSFASNYNWFFEGVSFSIEENPSLNLAGFEPGSFEICLTSTNNLGCSDSYCDTIVLLEEFTLFLPNAFTPNQSGLNDLFTPVYSGEHPADAELLIFDRWGLLIFSTDNFNTSWDGTYLGNPADEDVYIWKIKYRTTGTEIITRTGHVSLLR
ncbi:MAG: gliding motility-associated C-terminal domain-containing protein [Flavobacteriales bacterium]|nr:gliding motility-associated C-terminal domain-containing protein [Flavobacteriales bacterium]MCB9198314.1 gliding motility-associated C-terminal domain-containing protein [Flavobacteriales bacterium]